MNLALQVWSKKQGRITIRNGELPVRPAMCTSHDRADTETEWEADMASYWIAGIVAFIVIDTLILSSCYFSKHRH